MSVTSQWEWLSIDRREDLVASYPSKVYRLNWALTRMRISDEPYVSEIGNTETTLSGYNAGVTETVAAPSARVLTYTGANPVWFGQVLYPTGAFFGGYPVYESDLFSDACIALSITTAHQLFLYYDVVTTPDKTRAYAALAGSGPPYNAGVDCMVFIDDVDGWNIPPGFTSSSPTVPFICISDSQVYSEKGVDWYTQRQTWVARSRNVEDTL